MRDTDKPPATPAPDSARASSPRRRPSPGRAQAGRPAARETARLVCAVTLAASLGVACGLWINARLASAASASAAAPARLLPAARATPTTAAEASPAPEPTRADSFAISSTVEDAASTSGEGEADEAGSPRAKLIGASVESSVLKRGRGDAAAPAKGEPGSSVEAVRRTGAAPSAGSAAASRGQGGVSPCSLYASAGALTIRDGVAASLVLGGPGGAGPVSVTTPHWADIAVLSEGTAGGRGWVKYSVRSVSKRPGSYAVHVKSPCGSQSIPVTVARP